MDNKVFKQLFGEEAKANDFKKVPGGWYKESAECLITLALQKSNFGNYYLLRIGIYIQGAFGQQYKPDKEIMKRSIGHINSKKPNEIIPALDLDQEIEVDKRKGLLIELFEKDIVPYTEKALSTSGILELEERGEIFLLPLVKHELLNS